MAILELAQAEGVHVVPVLFGAVGSADGTTPIAVLPLQSWYQPGWLDESNVGVPAQVKHMDGMCRVRRRSRLYGASQDEQWQQMARMPWPGSGVAYCSARRTPWAHTFEIPHASGPNVSAVRRRTR